MDQRDQRPELDCKPHATPEPTTPPSPVAPVPAYRPPRTTPFRTSAVGEGEQPDPTVIHKEAHRRSATRRPGGGQPESGAAPGDGPETLSASAGRPGAGSPLDRRPATRTEAGRTASTGRPEGTAGFGDSSDGRAKVSGPAPGANAFARQADGTDSSGRQVGGGSAFDRPAEGRNSPDHQPVGGSAFDRPADDRTSFSSHTDGGRSFGGRPEGGGTSGVPPYGPGGGGGSDPLGDSDGAGNRPPHGSMYNPPPPPPPRRKQRSIVGPLILIFLGLFFLGQSFGWIQWSLWEVIWRLWPVWLIAAGLDMLFGQRGGWGRIVAVIVALALVAGILLGTQPLHVAPQPGQPITIAQPLEDISSAEIRIDASLSMLTIRGEPLSDSLIQGSVVPLPGENIRWGYSVRGGEGVFRLYSEMTRQIRSQGTTQARWDLVLTDRLPIRLDLNAGVGESDLDLSRLVVPELNVDAGVGQVSITLPGQGAVTGRIDAGVGEVVLRVPAGRPARIRIETGLGGASADDGFVKQNGYYVTPAYQDGVDAIDLVVSGGVGAVRLVTYGGS